MKKTCRRAIGCRSWRIFNRDRLYNTLELALVGDSYSYCCLDARCKLGNWQFI